MCRYKWKNCKCNYEFENTNTNEYKYIYLYLDIDIYVYICVHKYERRYIHIYIYTQNGPPWECSCVRVLWSFKAGGNHQNNLKHLHTYIYIYESFVCCITYFSTPVTITQVISMFMLACAYASAQLHTTIVQGRVSWDLAVTTAPNSSNISPSRV